MRELNDIVDTYFEAWNEPDADTRRALAEKAWAGDSRYVDPVSDVTGADGFAGMVAGIQEQFVGHSVVRTSAIDQHHDQIRFEWELRAPDGTIVIAGVDYGELAPDGRLQSITGFFGPVAQEEAA